MDWQQIAALTIVASAAALLLRGKLRRRKFSFEHSGGVCGGCTAVSATTPQNSIVFRARKGQRPEVVVKMK